MITLNHYGPLLARVRREKNIKAATVARHVGISEATYSQIETGHRSASLERVTSICIELGLSTVQFVEAWQQQTVIKTEKERMR